MIKIVQNFNIQNQNENHTRRPRDRGMQEYQQQTIVLNERNIVRETHARRREMIANNQPRHTTGDRVHHLRCIQMVDHASWSALFQGINLYPTLEYYANAAMNHFHDQTNTLNFVGQMEVSLLMQENYRQGVHLAIYFIHLTPHRHLYDGHMICVEFGHESMTHQTITRTFDTDVNAVVLQATEDQMISSLAEDDDVLELLQCFVPEFSPMRFSPDYGVDQNALDVHQWHDFAEYHAEIHHRPPPPPPPINNFPEIYQAALREYDAQHIPYENDQYQVIT